MTKAIKLNSPGCEAGCVDCELSCAIIPARLDWWRGEIESLSEAVALEGVSPSLLDRLETALAAHKGLERRYAASPRFGSLVSQLQTVRP
jgi:hypothetical protein